MRIIVMGGAGDMGSRAVEDLALQEGLEEITIADKNLDSAQKLAERLKDKPVQVNAKYVDAMDHNALVKAISGYDLVASALGPFYIFESRLIRACIKAEVNYASICDDWSAAEEVINRFSEPARERGVIIVTGLGTSPGISNVGVRYLADEMDEVERAEVYVYMPLRAGGGPAVIEHTLFIMSGEVPSYRTGQWVRIKACAEARLVDFPRFGKQKVWNMGHAEPVTIPRFIKGIKEVNFFMGFGRGSSLLVVPSKLGMFDRPATKRFFSKLLHYLEGIGSQAEPEWGAVRIDVWGKKEGKDAHMLGCGIGQMREATGLSLAVGALMMAREEITVKEGGVYAPEACFDPKKFLTYLKERGIQAYFDLEMTKPVV